MLLPIKKIETFTPKDNDGNNKKIPGSDRDVRERKVVEEAIDVWLVKAVRPYHKGFNDRDIDGEIAVVYLRPSEGKSAIEMHVVENWKTLTAKINELRRKE